MRECLLRHGFLVSSLLLATMGCGRLGYAELLGIRADAGADGGSRDGAAALDGAGLDGAGLDGSSRTDGSPSTDGGGTPDGAFPLDGGPPAVPWGTYAGTVAVPACPASPILLVDTTDGTASEPGISDPSEAGPTLSFPEAITIASNRPGGDTILFDEAVFPVDDPGTIAFSCGQAFDTNTVCIDARDRGVIMRWPEPTGTSCPGTIQLQEGSLAIGLTLLRLHQPMTVLTRSKVAGCRFNTDGYDAYPGDRFFDVEAGGGEVGPGNVFVDMWGVSLRGTANTRVVGNYFGHDPASGTSLGMAAAIEVAQEPGSGRSVVEGNVFAVPEGRDLFWSPRPGSDVVFRNNYVGVDRTGERLPGSWEGVDIFDPDGTFVLGPGNIIRGVRIGVVVNTTQNVRVTQNSIYENGTAILLTGIGPGPFPPPSITDVTEARVTGTCARDGTVEVFHDAANQGEVFVGLVACDASTSWNLSLEAPLPSGRNATAIYITEDQLQSSPFSAPFAVP